LLIAVAVKQTADPNGAIAIRELIETGGPETQRINVLDFSGGPGSTKRAGMGFPAS